MVSTINALYEKQFNCHECNNQYASKKDYEKNKETYDRSLSLLQFKKGCTETGPMKYEIDNLRFSRCPGNYYSHSAAMLVDFYYNYKEGHMPYTGALMDQPAKIIDLFNLIDGLIKRKQDEFNKKEIERSKGKNGRSKV